MLIIAKNYPKWRVWPNNTGSVKTHDNRWVNFGLKGSSDLIGLTDAGRIVCIEIKTGKARQGPQQKKFERMIRNGNGIYLIFRDTDTESTIIWKIQN